MGWDQGAATPGKELLLGCLWLPGYQVQDHHANRRYNDGEMGAEILSEDVELGVAAFLGTSAFLACADSDLPLQLKIHHKECKANLMRIFPIAVTMMLFEMCFG